MKWGRPKEAGKPDNSVVFVILDPCWVIFSERQVSFEKKYLKRRKNGASHFVSGSVFLDKYVKPNADNALERPLAKTVVIL